MNLHFRPMRSAELPQLVDLWVESWSDVYAGVSFEGRRSWFADHVETWTRRGGLCQVATDADDGSLAGFILHRLADGHLDQFCIRHDLKGRDAAVLMMNEVRRLSPSGIHLTVNALNARAIRFYERQGFAKTGDGVSPGSGLKTYSYGWRP